MITVLDAHAPFPPLSCALQDPNGLLAMGGDLQPQRLLQAYAQGIFPWYGPTDPILWWAPDPRTVILPNRLHLGRSTQRALKNHPFTITLNHDFAAVIQNCAAPRKDQDGTWIHPSMQAAYIHLQQLGYAHSVEVWLGKRLVGGVYGVRIHRAFFAESMFHLENNASKLALIYLIRWFEASGGLLFDCQMPSPHVTYLGARSMMRSEFVTALQTACAVHLTHKYTYKAILASS